jgi:hypothetical protein
LVASCIRKTFSFLLVFDVCLFLEVFFVAEVSLLLDVMDLMGQMSLQLMDLIGQMGLHLMDLQGQMGLHLMDLQGQMGLHLVCLHLMALLLMGLDLKALH